MADNIKWIEVDEVVRINKEIVAKSNEPHLTTNLENLLGALNRVYTAYEYNNIRQPSKLAAIYIDAISRAHGFIQGNKRTSFEAARRFLATFDLVIDESLDQERFANSVICIIDGKKRFTELTGIPSEVAIHELLDPYVVPTFIENIKLYDPTRPIP